MPGLLYADDLVLCSGSEEDLRVIVGWFAEVCRRRGLKVKTGKSKVMVLNGEEGLECEFRVDGMCLEYISKFKYLGCVLDELGTGRAECSRKVASGRRVAGATGPWLMLGICSLSMLEPCMKHYLCLSLCMAVRQCYEKRRRDPELGLYRWTTPEDY